MRESGNQSGRTSKVQQSWLTCHLVHGLNLRTHTLRHLAVGEGCTVFEWLKDFPWNHADTRNQGVLVDCQVRSREGHVLRLIIYQDALAGKVYEFLTNEPDLPPGVMAKLYRRRWETEKVFDELKNTLGQKKAWGTSLVAKEAQALLIDLTHNLLLAYEQDLEQRHEVTNTAEDQRRNQRRATAEQTCAKVGGPFSSLFLQARRATQRSVKFIR